MANDDTSRPPAAAQEAVHDPRGDRMTSGGLRLRDVPPDFRHEVEWIDGMHGAAYGLPSLDAVPVPPVLFELPRLHPDRPLGASATLDAAGATARLRGCRPGAWLISPRSGWHWAVWPDGEVGWKPRTVALPPELRVSSRNDIT